MGARDYWDRMLVYFGIADDWDAPEEADPVSDRRRGREPAAPRYADDEPFDDIDPAPARSRSRSRATGPSRAASRAGGAGEQVAGVGVVPPRTFNDAQQIADQFKRGLPVIVNLQATDRDLAKRLIDFASGLTYGLDGRMQNIADKVFLLTPPDVDVSAEDRAAMVESGFFNQS